MDIIAGRGMPRRRSAKMATTWAMRSKQPFASLEIITALARRPRMWSLARVQFWLTSTARIPFLPPKLSRASALALSPFHIASLPIFLLFMFWSGSVQLIVRKLVAPIFPDLFNNWMSRPCCHRGKENPVA